MDLAESGFEAVFCAQADTATKKKGNAPRTFQFNFVVDSSVPPWYPALANIKPISSLRTSAKHLFEHLITLDVTEASHLVFQITQLTLNQFFTLLKRRS